jgi:hypothetical protein
VISAAVLVSFGKGVNEPERSGPHRGTEWGTDPNREAPGQHGDPHFVLRTLARPEGLEHAPPTIVIEGVDELVATLRAA